MKAKVFDGKFSRKVVKVRFELEFSVDEDVDLTTTQVKRMIGREDRTDIGETVLNFLDQAEVLTD